MNSSSPGTAPQVSRDGDFERSMGVDIHGTGVRTPADFERGRPITIISKPGDKPADTAAPRSGKATPAEGEKGKVEYGFSMDSKVNPGSGKPESKGSDSPPATEPSPGGGTQPPAAPPGIKPPPPSAEPGSGGTRPRGGSGDPKPVAPPTPGGPTRHANADPGVGTQNAAGDDAVSTRMTRGFERDPANARPTDTRVQGGGIAAPKCMAESQDGVSC